MSIEHNDEEAIFYAALELKSKAEQDAYIKEACRNNISLLKRIQVLLKAHDAKDKFLEVREVPFADLDVTLGDSLEFESPGTKIGRYELLELIGEGGMGLVYLAQQKKPIKRRVALKIIKPGMDSKQVIARFVAEKQTLAVLDHPNIAHVLDAGTTKEGRPYFIMEYVKGMSITRYCDENKLNIEQRLRLFEQTCEGIHHAHQKGIIHRDLKPSNILVSVHGDRAVPKIIDFGIAKAVAQPLTEKTFVTFQGQLLGTPEYMSPEQVDMATQDIDTRSDIYSLGVVLYELLAGVLPFDRESFASLGYAEVQRTIREQEPASPSIRLTNLGEQAKTIAASRDTHVVALARCLHRELEWIPLKAMRKDRCRRYRSTFEMADDVRNYLNGLPLIAGPETAIYHAKKFVHKHAGSVATAALLTLAVALGLVVSIVMGCRAEQARQKEVAARIQVEQALARAERAEKVAQVQREFAEEQRALAEKLAEDYRLTLYCNRVALAEIAYRDTNIERLRQLLDLCPEDLRGWEWSRLDHLRDQSLKTLRGHTDQVYGVAISPDGKRIMSGSNDKTIKLWDASSGAELMTIQGHQDKVGPVAFGPAGKKIASAGTDFSIKVWDAMTGAESVALHGHSGVIWSIEFSPDGKQVVSASSDDTIRIWDVMVGEELMSLQGHESSVFSATFSPDGAMVASGGEDAAVRLWDVARQTEIVALKNHESRVLSVAFSPDGKRIASGSQDNTIRVWDAENGTELTALRGHADDVRSVVWSPDGERLASGSNDRTIKIWDLSTGTDVMTLRGHAREVWNLAFSPDGNHIISSSRDNTLRVWDTRINRERVDLKGKYCVSFSPDGNRVMSGGGDGLIRIWDMATGTQLATLQGHEGDVRCISFSPDSRKVISAGYDKTLRIWDVATAKELMMFGEHKHRAWSMAVSPDGRRIASTGWSFSSPDKDSGEIRLWDAATGSELPSLYGHTAAVVAVAFSPDSRLLVSSGYDKTQRIWDVETGDELMTLEEKDSRTWSIAFSPDGKHVFSGQSDGKIKIWDIDTGSQLMVLKGHAASVISLAISSDGRRMVSGSSDKTAKMWDVATGTEVATFPASGYVWSVAFSPDDNAIAFSCNDGSVTLLESTVPISGYELRQTGVAAQKVVADLHEELGLYHEVIGKLKTDETLDQSVRKVALQIANARLWEDVDDSKESVDDGDKE